MTPAIRLASADDLPRIARVQVAAWRTTYRGIVSDAYLDTLTESEFEERQPRQLQQAGVFYLVAEAPDEGIVGFIRGGPERTQHARFTGEFQALYLLAEYRRLGVGSRLMHACAARLREAGHRSAMVWALEANTPATQFYQRLGGVYHRDQIVEIAGDTFRELAFGWDDLSRL